MAKPVAVQKLKHGKALCGATFGQFVETFNWLVDFCLNLKGDKEFNAANGTVIVDRSDDSAPVIRVAVKGANGEGKDGKLIKDVDISPDEAETVVTFTYTDDSTDEIHIPHGQDGEPGKPGEDGGTPEISADRQGDKTYIYADGALIATILDGNTPSITAEKAGGVTTIFADGVAIATISDGADGGGEAEMPDLDVVTGVSFSVSSGKLKATVAKKNLKTGTASQANVNVCNISELDVVTSEVYSTSTHQFTNTRKRIQVIGSPVAAQGETPFTATPLSSE